MRLIAMSLVGCALVAASVAPSAAQQGRVVVPGATVNRPAGRVIHEDMSLRTGGQFGSVPSASERTRITTVDPNGRETHTIIEEAPVSAGSGVARGATRSFGSVPEFTRDIRITTDAPGGTPPIVILPILPLMPNR
jgi:hypothetical protein